MREHKASTTIDVAPEAVWSALVDVAAHCEWDPGCERIEGRVARGQSLRVYSRQRPGKVLRFAVSELHPTHKMIWSAALACGLVKGQRTYILTSPDTGVTRLVVKESWSGPLLGLLGGSIPDPRLAEMLAGLKRRLEGL